MPAPHPYRTPNSAGEELLAEGCHTQYGTMPRDECLGHEDRGAKTLVKCIHRPHCK